MRRLVLYCVVNDILLIQVSFSPFSEMWRSYCWILQTHIIQIIIPILSYLNTYIYDTSFRNVVQPWVELRFNTHLCNWNVFNTFISESIISGGMLLRFMFWIYSLPFTGVLLHHCYNNNGLNQSGWPNQRKHLLKETIRQKARPSFWGQRN